MQSIGKKAESDQRELFCFDDTLIDNEKLIYLSWYYNFKKSQRSCASFILSYRNIFIKCIFIYKYICNIIYM